MTTDTRPMAPTDAEIVALADATRTAEGGANGYILPISFCRAVLAKWGSQPLRYDQSPTLFTVFAKCDEYEGEVPLAQYSATSEYGVLDRVMGDARNAGYTGHAKDRMTELGWRIVPVYATPQPVVRWPLTKEQAESLCKMGPVYAPDGQVVRTPEQYRRELEGAKLAGIRTAERAHGIKGGQHGAE